MAFFEPCPAACKPSREPWRSSSAPAAPGPAPTGPRSGQAPLRRRPAPIPAPLALTRRDRPGATSPAHHRDCTGPVCGHGGEQPGHVRPFRGDVCRIPHGAQPDGPAPGLRPGSVPDGRQCHRGLSQGQSLGPGRTAQRLLHSTRAPEHTPSPWPRMSGSGCSVSSRTSPPTSRPGRGRSFRSTSRPTDLRTATSSPTTPSGSPPQRRRDGDLRAVRPVARTRPGPCSHQHGDAAGVDRPDVHRPSIRLRPVHFPYLLAVVDGTEDG